MADPLAFYRGLYEAQRRVTEVLRAGLDDLGARVVELERKLGVTPPAIDADAWTVEGALDHARRRLGALQEAATALRKPGGRPPPTPTP